MSKFNKTILIIYSVILAFLIGFLIYKNYFTTKFDYVSTKRLVTVIFASLIAVIKLSTRSTGNRKTLGYYKKFYSETIKDSFADNKKNLKTLLKAAQYYNEDKFSAALDLLSSLQSECHTNNERYAVNIFSALINTDTGNTEDAIEIYERMIQMGIADSVIFSNLLNLYKEEGNSQKAYETGLRAIHADPKNVMAYNNFAYFLFNDGNYDEAEEYAKKALEIKSNTIEAITLLYIIYTLENKTEEAELYERKSIANGRSKKVLKEIMDYYLGEDED